MSPLRVYLLKNLNLSIVSRKTRNTPTLLVAFTLCLPMPSTTEYIAFHNVYDVLMMSDARSVASDTDAASDAVSVVTVDSDAFAAPRLPTPTHEIVTSLSGCVRSTRD